MKKTTTPSEHNVQAKRILFTLLRYWWIAAIVLGLWACNLLYQKITKNSPVKLDVIHDTRIDVSPEEISSILEIKQWEFLSISTEEMVEWHQKSTFGDKHLVRIYKGTLRIGIDMERCTENWFTSSEDSTAILKLPTVGLLDMKFIDEASTRSFYEKGRIPTTVYDDLYTKAQNAMLKRSLTPQNLKQAETYAIEQFTRIFKSLGFKNVYIQFISTDLS